MEDKSRKQSRVQRREKKEGKKNEI